MRIAIMLALDSSVRASRVLLVDAEALPKVLKATYRRVDGFMVEFELSCEKVRTRRRYELG